MNEQVECAYCGKGLSRALVPGPCPHCGHELKVVLDLPLHEAIFEAEDRRFLAWVSQTLTEWS